MNEVRPGAKTQSYPLSYMANMQKFEEGDYYMTPEGFIVFTEKYHLNRGYCCHNSCRHCPWAQNKKENNPENKKNEDLK